MTTRSRDTTKRQLAREHDGGVRHRTGRRGVLGAFVAAGMLATLLYAAPTTTVAAAAPQTDVNETALDIGPDGRIEFGDDVQRMGGGTGLLHEFGADFEPSADGDGYWSIFDNVGIRQTYQVRIVANGPWQQLTPRVKEAIIQLNAATGANYYLGSNTSQHVTDGYAGIITVAVAGYQPCGLPSEVAGCTTMDDPETVGSGKYQWGGANVWINPDLLDTPGAFKHTILHELGHAAGLDHYDDSFAGSYQVMESVVYVNDPSTHLGTYQNGDENGLSKTAALGFANGYLIPRSCLPTIVDVRQNSVFCGDITWMIDQDISTGYVDGTWKPGETTTRQHAAAFLYRYLGEPPVPGGAPTFSDVPSGPFRNAIRYLASQGIIAGQPDGTFNPLGGLSRQAMASLLYKLAGSPALPPDAPTFSDVPPGGTFTNAISWLALTGITTGYPDGTFKPTSPTTRAQMARFLHVYDSLGT